MKLVYRLWESRKEGGEIYFVGQAKYLYPGSLWRDVTKEYPNKKQAEKCLCLFMEELTEEEL